MEEDDDEEEAFRVLLLLLLLLEATRTISNLLSPSNVRIIERKKVYHSLYYYNKIDFIIANIKMLRMMNLYLHNAIHYLLDNHNIIIYNINGI